MASLQKFPSGTFHITIPFGGKRYKRSLKTKDRKTALAIQARVEDTTKLVEQGRIEIPSSADIPTFLLSDGKASRQLEAPKDAKLNKLFKSYFDSIPEGSLDPGTIRMMKTHARHLIKHLGGRLSLRTLTQGILQSYIGKRSKEPGIRGRNAQAATIKKELTTLRGLWKWSVISEQLPNAPFPSVGLRFPISEDLPPFQTFETVLKQTRSLDPESAEFKDLWATVFLNQTEIEELLGFVKKNARHTFIYPMFVFAAHTGARKSEILRSQMTDFGSGLVSVRERKRKKGRKSTRQLPLSSCRDVQHAEYLIESSLESPSSSLFHFLEESLVRKILFCNKNPSCLHNLVDWSRKHAKSIGRDQSLSSVFSNKSFLQGRYRAIVWAHHLYLLLERRNAKYSMSFSSSSSVRFSFANVAALP